MHDTQVTKTSVICGGNILPTITYVEVNGKVPTFTLCRRGIH